MVDTSGVPWKTYSDFKHYYTLEDKSPTFTLNAGDFDLSDALDGDKDAHEDNVFGVNFVDGFGQEPNPYRRSFWENTPVNWKRGSGWTVNSYNLHGVHVAGVALAKARVVCYPSLYPYPNQHRRCSESLSFIHGRAPYEFKRSDGRGRN